MIEDIEELYSMKKKVLRYLIENSPTYIFINDSEGQYIYSNETFLEDTGYTENELKNANSFDLIHPDDQDIILDSLSSVMHGATVKDIEYRFLFKDGNYRNFSTNVSPIFNAEREIIAILSATNDVTYRKRIENELQEQEKRFRLLFERSVNPIFWIDTETGIIQNCNTSATKFLERDKDELIGHHHTELYLPEDRENVDKIFHRVIKDGGDRVEGLQLVTKSGKLKPIEILTTEISMDGRIIRQGVLIDISERYTSERVLRESEERYRLLFQNMLDAYAYHKVVTDDSGKPIDYIYIDINPAFTKFTGLTREQVIGKRVTEAIPGTENDPADWIGRFGEVGLKGTTIQVEEYSKALDRYYIVNGYSPKKGYFAVTFTDITTKKKLEEERLRYLKIDSLSLLAGGIAHDYNNLLVGILGNINILQTHKDLNDNTNEILAEMENASLRASQLTNQLLTFSKGGNPVTKPESIKEIIKDTSAFVLRGSKSNCIINIPTDLPLVNIDAGQINQVISNLLINADQAMSNGGTIGVSVNKENIMEENEFGLNVGEYIKITIADEGQGISKHVIPKIFDPYFTTKTTGSGLGLATSYSIVKRHNGHIAVTSQVGEGSQFTVYLPVSGQEMAEEIEQQVSSYTFDDTALLMDDDDIIRKTVKHMLEELNIRTDVAKDGEEAIQLYKEKMTSGDRYSFVIMDLTIPGGMSGRECIKELIKIDPRVNAIVSSGYSNDTVMANYEEYGFNGVLSKPFTLNQLHKLLSQLKVHQ
jgi:PAS domain S-box-containing protein